jgi:hypothetical protein
LLNPLVSLASTPANQWRDIMEKHNLAVWFGQLYAYSEQLFPKIMLYSCVVLMISAIFAKVGA